MPTRQYFKVNITETGRNTLKENPQTFNTEVQTFKTLEEVKTFLAERYGKIPDRRHSNTIFIDGNNGSGIPVGFLKSYWNKDWSHNTKNWYQTDWVEVSEVTESPVLIN